MRAVQPIPNQDDEYFWEGVARGELLLRACAACGRVQHPPTPMCPACGALEWTTVASAGRGTVHSWIVTHHPSQADEEPRITVLVELAEGVRLVSNLVGIAPDAVANELAVDVLFAEVDGVRLPQFRPAGGAS